MRRRVFIYEFLTGGGTWTQPDSPLPCGSLLEEGQAMVSALVADFAALPETAVVVLRDSRLPQSPTTSNNVQCLEVASAAEHERQFLECAANCTRTLLVAPEFDGLLLDLCRLAEAAGANLLSPDSRLIAMADDKNETARVLAAAGIPVPPGALWNGCGAWPPHVGLPAVLKPNRGAGSLGLRVLRGATPLSPAALDGVWRLESRMPGRSASAAVLCGPMGKHVLPACWQILSDDDEFRYLGGATPLPDELDHRARRLALRAAEALPASVGYLGVDLILGPEPTGRQDVVIELNPRITTSYVGLRRALPINLADVMWALADGRPVELPSGVCPVQFDADGTMVKFG